MKLFIHNCISLYILWCLHWGSHEDAAKSNGLDLTGCRTDLRPCKGASQVNTWGLYTHAFTWYIIYRPVTYLYVIVWYCMFILFCVKCIQCSMVPIRLYVSTLFNPVRPKQILRRLCSMLTLGIADEMIQFTLMHVNTQLFPLLVCCKKIEFYITFYPCLLWSRPCCGAQTCFVALILEMSWTWFDMICVAAIDAILLPCVFVCGGKIFLTLEINICDESMMPQPRSNWSSGILLEMSS